MSTRRVDKLVEQMGVKGISKSPVSEMSKVLGAQVWVDAPNQKVREGSRIVHVLVATRVNADGHREILGGEVTSAEDGAGWPAFLRGLVEAIGAMLPGAAWWRCWTH